MHKNLLKLSKFEEKEEKKTHAKLGQNYSKLVENVTISQRGAEKKRLSKLWSRTRFS